MSNKESRARVIATNYCLEYDRLLILIWLRCKINSFFINLCEYKKLILSCDHNFGLWNWTSFYGVWSKLVFGYKYLIERIFGFTKFNSFATMPTLRWIHLFDNAVYNHNMFFIIMQKRNLSNLEGVLQWGWKFLETHFKHH